jgi:hypothetical protein
MACRKHDLLPLPKIGQEDSVASMVLNCRAVIVNQDVVRVNVTERMLA